MIKITYECSDCEAKGSNLSFNAEAIWNENKQQFDMNRLDSLELAFCKICDNWVEAKEIELK